MDKATPPPGDWYAALEANRVLKGDTPGSRTRCDDLLPWAPLLACWAPGRPPCPHLSPIARTLQAIRSAHSEDVWHNFNNCRDMNLSQAQHMRTSKDPHDIVQEVDWQQTTTCGVRDEFGSASAAPWFALSRAEECLDAKQYKMCQEECLDAKQYKMCQGTHLHAVIELITVLTHQVILHTLFIACRVRLPVHMSEVSIVCLDINHAFQRSQRSQWSSPCVFSANPIIILFSLFYTPLFITLTHLMLNNPYAARSNRNSPNPTLIPFVKQIPPASAHRLHPHVSFFSCSALSSSRSY